MSEGKFPGYTLVETQDYCAVLVRTNINFYKEKIRHLKVEHTILSSLAT